MTVWKFNIYVGLLPQNKLIVFQVNNFTKPARFFREIIFLNIYISYLEGEYIMKWLIPYGLIIYLPFANLAFADDVKILQFSDSEQFYKELEAETFRRVNFNVVTDFTHPEQVPETLSNIIKLEKHKKSLVNKEGSFVEGAKTTAIMTLAGASVASAISMGAVVGSAFMARGVAAGAAVGAAGGPIAPATIGIAAGIGALVGFTIGVTVVVMSGDEHEMTFEIDPAGKFTFHVKPV